MGIDALRRRAVFLDRDGVLNRSIIRDGKPFPPDTVDQLEILPGVEDACSDLRAAGFALVVVTNQPDVARGTQTRALVEQMNQLLVDRLHLDAVMVCYHDDQDDCLCRKPKPGLLSEAAGQLEIDLAKSFMIGDRWKDIEAGRRAGCTTIFVDSGHIEVRTDTGDCEVSSLRAGADWILSQKK